MKKLNNEKLGFTLIELMVVMAIIAILATLIVGAVQLARRTATETTHRTNGKTIQTALEGVYAKYRVYCGGTSPVTCTPTNAAPSNTVTTSFFTAAGVTTPGSETQLSVKLSAAASAGSCAGGQANEGGGRVMINPGAYTIIPVNYACTGANTSTTTAAAGDMTPDIISMP